MIRNAHLISFSPCGGTGSGEGSPQRDENCPGDRPEAAGGDSMGKNLSFKRSVFEMRKLFLSIIALLISTTSCMASESEAVVEAIRAASRPADDPIIGIWKVYDHASRENRSFHVAVVENETDTRQGWGYLGIILEEGTNFFRIKPGSVILAFQATEIPRIYDARFVCREAVISMQAGGPAFLDGKVLDMIRVQSLSAGPVSPAFAKFAPVTHMVKVDDYQPKIDISTKRSGLRFEGLRIQSIEPYGLAADSGLRVGDMIVEMNGRAADENLLSEIDTRLADGLSVTITYRRNGRLDVVSIKNRFRSRSLR